MDSDRQKRLESLEGWEWSPQTGRRCVADYMIRDLRGEDMPDPEERKSMASEIKPRKLVIIHDSLRNSVKVEEGAVPGLEVKASTGGWMPSTQKLRSELEQFRKKK